MKRRYPVEYVKRCVGEALPHFERGETLIQYLPTMAIKTVIYVAAACGIVVTFVGPSIWWFVLPLVFLLFLVSPYQVWRTTQKRVEELEEQRRERLRVEAILEEQFPLHRPGGYLLSLTNDGLDPIDGCYVRLVEFIWKTYSTNAAQEKRTAWIPMFSTDDIHFRWKGKGDEARHTFTKSAIVEIAMEVAAGGGITTWALSGVGSAPRDFDIRYDGPFFIVLEIGARNHDPIKRLFRLIPTDGHGKPAEWTAINETDMAEYRSYASAVNAA